MGDTSIPTYFKMDNLKCTPLSDLLGRSLKICTLTAESTDITVAVDIHTYDLFVLKCKTISPHGRPTL